VSSTEILLVSCNHTGFKVHFTQAPFPLASSWRDSLALVEDAAVASAVAEAALVQSEVSGLSVLDTHQLRVTILK